MDDNGAKKESLKTLLQQLKSWKKDDIRKKSGKKQEPELEVEVEDDEEQQDDALKMLIKKLAK